MKLAERGRQLSNKLWLREIRKPTDSGHQTSILTTNFQAPMTTLTVSLLARWSCARTRSGKLLPLYERTLSLDRLTEYGTEPVPDAISVVNPEWRKLDSQLRSKAGRRHRLAAQFGALALSEDPAESELQSFQQRKGYWQEEIQVPDAQIDQIKQLRKKTEHHIPVKSLPEQDRFTRLRTERKSTSSIRSGRLPVALNPAWPRCCANIWPAVTMIARYCARSSRQRRILYPIPPLRL
jgi:hypothetical protein